jgi:ribonuclease HI
MRPSWCPRCGRSPLDLRRRNHLGGQRCGRSRETRRRACTTHLEASLLHQRSAIRDQNLLPTNPEATVRSDSNTAKAATLLRVSSGDCGVILPLGEIIQCREASGRIAKWAVELIGETLSFAPRKAIKSQVLADFLAEWTDTQLPTAPIQAELWTMYFDGSLMKIGAGAGLLFISPLGEHVRYVIRLHFPASNNVAEYEALVNGLHIAIDLGVRRLDARGDSQLVIDQVMKNSHCRDQKMEAYCDEVRRLEDKFYGLELNHIARRYNDTVDELAKIASGRTTVPPNVFSRDIYQPSVKLNDAPEPEKTSAQPEVPSTAEGEALLVEIEQNGVTPNLNW